MKPKPTEPEKQPSKDLETFEELPEKTKELHRLSEEAEKETGKDREALDRAIQTKSKRN